MQKLILIFILITYTLGAPVDKAFFEGDNVLHYYGQIEKEINSTISHKLKDPKIIELERSTLEKLKHLHETKSEIRSFPTITFPKYYIPQNQYLKALYLLTDLSREIERLQQKEKEFQEKLFDLKNKIEKEVPSTPQSTLLSDQMQYAFYKISKDKIKKSLDLYNTLFNKEFVKFQKALPRVRFTKSKYAQNIIHKTEQKIDILEKKDLLLTIDKDSTVLHPKKENKKIAQNAKKIQQESEKILIERIQIHIRLILKYLQKDNQTEYLKTMEIIDKDITKLSTEKKKMFRCVANLLIKLSEVHSDTASVAIASTQVGFQNILKSIHKFINKTLFVYEEKAFSIKTVITFSFIVFIGLFIAKIYKNIVDSFRKTRRIKSLSTARLIANSGYYLIILTTFFIALKTIGLDMHTTFLVIGAILLWLAFGLQSFISNYAIGILLKIDRSIRIGDHIELDPQTVGDVDDMDFRSVTIRSSDNIRTTIPNSRFISGTFINYSLEGISRRLHIDFSADKMLSSERIEKRVLEALETCDIPHFRTADKKAQVIIIDINRKIVRYALLVWVPKEMTYDMSTAQSKFLKVIHKAIYPQQHDLSNYKNHAPV